MTTRASAQKAAATRQAQQWAREKWLASLEDETGGSWTGDEQAVAERVVERLATLPVEMRMPLMGMKRAGVLGFTSIQCWVEDDRG